MSLIATLHLAAQALSLIGDLLDTREPASASDAILARIREVYLVASDASAGRITHEAAQARLAQYQFQRRVGREAAAAILAGRFPEDT